jgi:hypothetical protein
MALLERTQTGYKLEGYEGDVFEVLYIGENARQKPWLVLYNNVAKHQTWALKDATTFILRQIEDMETV